MQTDDIVLIQRRGAAKWAAWFASLTALFSALTFGIAATTLPISGPFCQANCIHYPYRDVAAYVPHDYLWMFPAMLLIPVFLILMGSIHYAAAPQFKFFSQMALLFALLYAAVMSANYAIQVETMQTSILYGETDSLVLFSQYNPHGIFITLENLGYLAMSLAFAFAAPVFAGPTLLERSIRWLLRAAAALAFLGLIAYSIIYGFNVEYRFEVLIITINYMTLLAGGTLLAVYFRRSLKQAAV